MCISTDESFFILKFSQEVVDAAKDNKDAVTEDGIEDAFEVRFYESIISVRAGYKNPSRGSPIGIGRLVQW